MSEPIRQITALELKAMIDKKEDFCLIDVREAGEKEICHINGELIPVSQVEASLDRIPKDKKTIIHCHAGGRSARVIKFLQDKYGYKNLYNLSGGILSWIDDVDQSLTRY